MPQTDDEQRFEKHLRNPGDDVEVRDADDDGPATIRIPVSSTAQDRDGDQFSREGLENMRDQLAEGTVPMMLDHGRGSEGGYYGTLGMVGRWDGGEIVSEKDADDDVHVLIGEGTLNPANEHADKLREFLEADMPVGASVGFRILEYDHDRDEGSYTFHSVDLLETSLVGIPSNPLTVNDGQEGIGALAKAFDDGNLEGHVFARTLASLSETSLTELRDALDDIDTNDMSNDDPGGDDPATDDPDDFAELRDSVERNTDAVGELVDSIDSLLEEERSTDPADADGDDDPEKDTTPDDPEEEPERRSLEVYLDEEADEKAVEEFEALEERATDDGAIDLADSKTRLFGEEDESPDDHADSGDNGGLI